MKIVWVSFRGRWSDSPRALYEEMVRRGVDAEHTWLSAPGTPFPAGVVTVPFGSPECVAALESADLLVSNDHVPLDWVKRPGAVYLQTWHGTPLKRIHRDVRWAPEGRLAYLEQDIARWDLMLSPNSASTPLFQRAFGFDGPVHETGYPRNDVLSAPDRDARRAAVRAGLGIPDGTTAVLYTPTWRDDAVFADGSPDFTLHLDVADFAERLGGDHVLLVRAHSMVSDALELDPDAAVLDVSGHPDVAELYLAADVMVTDYSSTMFDFAVTGRPMLFFTYDLADYRDRLRGFYVELADIAPGPVLETSEQVMSALADLDRVVADSRDRYARFRDTYCSLEDGRATDRVLELLAELVPLHPALTAQGGDRAHR